MRLPFPRKKDWRCRWVFVARRNGIHRLAEIDDARRFREEPFGVRGKTVCGFSGVVSMPGFASRMFAGRCPGCCRGLGIPAGFGAPVNDKSLPKKARGA